VSKLLVVDDEQSICWGLSRLGESLGHEVIAASSAEQAFEQANYQSPDVIILDVRLPGIDGLTAIERFQKQLGSVPIIVITAYGDLRTAVEAVRCGAFDYIAKPFDVDKVKGALVRALVSRDRDLGHDDPPVQVEGMVGRSAAMQELYKRIALAAASDAAVLLSGEAGTGKELAARAIHRFSRRSQGPFIAVSLAGIDPHAVESHLFGQVRDVLAGGEENQLGWLRQAQGGTLYLDEVSELPLAVQAKLLRALEHQEVIPVGTNQSAAFDVRVISATRQNLLQRTAELAFRHDLLFRLGAFPIDLPPLRDRAEDIADLANYFVARIARGPRGKIARIATDTFRELESRPWHGNVRELRNAIDHALILARGPVILPEHLPPRETMAPTPQPSGEAIDDLAGAVRRWADANVADPALSGKVYERLLEVIEPPLFDVALGRHRNQCAAAARTLGIHRTTLRKKITQHRLDALPGD
jgi:two-component system nitrogen regulation response regulator GlnG